jgi:PAS domain S-box-containing protein
MGMIEVTGADAWDLIFENAEMAMALYDDRGDIVAANRAMERLVGVARSEVIGASRQILTVLDGEGGLHDFGRFLRDRAPCSGIATLRRNSGATLDVVFTAGRNGANSALEDASGETFMVTLADVADERCLTCRIRDSRDRFREAVDEQPEMLCRCLPDTTITFVNEGFATLFNRTPREMLGRRLTDLTPPEARAALDDHLGRFSPARPIHDLRGPLRRPSGDLVYLSWRRRAQFSGDGALVAFTATARNVTAQVDAERRADLGEERFRQVFDQSPGGMALVDHRGRLVQINRALATLMGREPVDLLGSVVLDHMPADSREDDLAWLRALLDHPDGLPPSERRLVTAQGPLWVEIGASPLPGDGVAPPLIILNVLNVDKRHRDADDLRRSRDRAEAASEAKSYFIHNMSHELRTPLNAIIGFGEVIGTGLPGLPLDERYKDYAQDIVASGRHLLAIINDILDIARVETGAFTLAVESVDLTEVVEESLTLIRDRALAKDLTLRTPSADGTDHRVHGDRRAIKQIIINLLTNAVKFTGRGGEVGLFLDPHPRGVAVHVRDTGIGVAPVDQERIFEPFVQAEAARDPDQYREGTGLGLPLCRKLAEMHGGALTLVSAPNRGSQFTLFLPHRAD